MPNEMAREDKWIEYGLIAFGAIGTVIGVGTWLGARFEILLAFVAGGGWALVIALLVIIRRSNTEHERLRTDLSDLRQQTEEWRSVAVNNAESLNGFITKAFPTPVGRPRTRKVPPRRQGN